MPAFQPQSVVDFASVQEKDASAVQAKLLEVMQSNDAFEVGVVALLEQYLDEQIANVSVDIDAQLALLKLYLVHPAKSNTHKVTKVLVKGIMASPSPFFTGASTLVTEALREDANIMAALNAGFLLQSCLFEQFWAADLSFAKSVKGFEAAVRASILSAIRRSHNAIALKTLQAKLNLSEKETQAAVAAETWTLEGELVKIDANEDNQMRPKKIQENIEFDDVLKVIHTLSR